MNWRKKVITVIYDSYKTLFILNLILDYLLNLLIYYFLQTQPVPNPLSYYLHKSPVSCFLFRLI